MTEGSPLREGACREEWTVARNMEDALTSKAVLTKQTRIAELARVHQRIGDGVIRRGRRSLSLPSESLSLKNRMRVICSYGTVGGLGRKAQVYPEVKM